MRDPDRIDRILSLLKKFWHRHPDLRLGQIMSNVAPNTHDPFYIEDNILEERLKEASNGI